MFKQTLRQWWHKANQPHHLLYLGRPLALKNDAMQKKPLMQCDYIALNISDPKADEQLRQMLRKQTLHYCQVQTTKLASAMGITPPMVKVRRYKRRLGCCYPTRNTLVFHERLIQAPPHIIHYVIIHELCHLEHPNHSKAFWQAVQTWDPNFKAHHQLASKTSVYLYTPLLQNNWHAIHHWHKTQSALEYAT